MSVGILTLPSPGNFQNSSSSGTFTTSSTSTVDVTNLSVSINCNGRPIMLFLMPDGSGNPCYAGPAINDASIASSYAHLYFVDGVSLLSDFPIGIHELADPAETSVAVTLKLPPGGFMMITSASVGAHTFKVTASVEDAGCVLHVKYLVLAAIQL